MTGSRPDVGPLRRRARRLAAVLAFTSAAIAPVVGSPTGARPAQPEFPDGTGSGTGRVAAVQVRSSGVSVGVVMGRATARYQGVQGNAESSIFDPGLLGTFLQAPLVCGRALSEFVPPESMPQPVTVSSGGGESSEQSAFAGDVDSPIRFGTQRAAAAPSSRAEAAVDGVTLEVPGVVTVLGGDADSRAELTPGRQRVGQSRIEVGSVELGGGIVRLGDLVWTADHRTGADTGSNSSFTVGSMRVAGLDVPVGSADQLSRGIDVANVALASLGIALSIPESTSTDTTAASSPMRITISPTPALVAALAPLNEQIQPMRTALLDLLEPFALGEDCSLPTVVGFSYLVVDLVAMAMSSGGGVDLLLGGASAGTDDVAFVNPFRSIPRPPPMVPTTTATTTTTTTTTAPPSPPVAPPAPSTTEPILTQVAAAPVAASVTSCLTTHVAGRPGCSAGAAEVAGIVALVLVGALALADRVRSREPTDRGDRPRRTRRTPNLPARDRPRRRTAGTSAPAVAESWAGTDPCSGSSPRSCSSPRWRRRSHRRSSVRRARRPGRPGREACRPPPSRKARSRRRGRPR